MEELEQNYKALYKYFVAFKSQLEDLKQQLHQHSEIDPLQVLQSQVSTLQRQLQDQRLWMMLWIQQVQKSLLIMQK
jgi:archaellum component FlaC